jgi:predicted DNA-binding WGR domain protein
MPNIVNATVTTAYQRDSQSNTDKYYRTYAVGGNVIFQWGRRGTTGQFKVAAVGLTSSAEAVREASKQMNAKLRKGYGQAHVDEIKVDLDRVSMDSRGCIVLDNLFTAQVRKIVPEDQGRDGTRQVLSTSVQAVQVDKLAALSDRIQDAITLSVTDPKSAFVEFAKLNAAWAEQQTAIERCKSFLETLDVMVSAA